MPKPTEDQERAKRTPLGRLGLVVVGVLTGMLSVGTAAGLGLLVYAEGQIDRISVPVDAEPGDPERPQNVLILGSDSREGQTKGEQRITGSAEDVPGRRSDTIILGRFDPRSEKTILVHFPRDLRVQIPGRGTDRINAAFRVGGPQLAVRTVRRFTGLPIHHYVEVDFAGFRNIVDALGGVRVCVDRPMVDRLAGLNLRKAGCHWLEGTAALAFVRARNVEGDLVPDFARISRQQQFIRAVVSKVFRASSLWRLPQLLVIGARNVTTDEDISLSDLYDVGRDLRGLGTEDSTGRSTVDLRVVPAMPRTIAGTSYVVARQPATRRLFRALRLGEPLGNLGTELSLTRISPAQIEVLVAGDETQRRGAAKILRGAGFIVAGTQQFPQGLRRSAIFYRGERDRARVVSGFFPGLPVKRDSEGLVRGVDVVVVVGDDYTKVIE